MARVEITGIERAHPHAGIRGAVDAPKPGSRSQRHSIQVAGWLLGDPVGAVAVEIVAADGSARRLALDVERRDVADAFPDVPNAGNSGFRTMIGTLGAEPEMLVHLRAVLSNQRRVSFATLRARRLGQVAEGDDRPLISVVIPSFEQAHYLPEAIESVLAQTYPHLELVVVDDGSHDNTEAVSSRYPGVRYVRQENRGLAAARNTGIVESSGNLLVFLDADDRLLPDALERGHVVLAEHSESAFAAGSSELIQFDGSMFPSILPQRLRNGFAEVLRGGPIWAPGSVLFRRWALDDEDTFDGSIDPAADYDLYYRVSRQHPVTYYDDVVVQYRRHGGNMTLDPARMLRANVTALARQRAFVRRSADLRAAFEEGLDYWRSFYAPQVLDAIGNALRSREWKRAATDVSTLLRFSPRALGELPRVLLGRLPPDPVARRGAALGDER